MPSTRDIAAARSCRLGARGTGVGGGGWCWWGEWRGVAPTAAAPGTAGDSQTSRPQLGFPGFGAEEGGLEKQIKQEEL
jgi:hypothetical protein